MKTVLARCASFFDLFRDFRGYVEFFSPQDLVTADCSVVQLSLPFDDFIGSPVPADVDEYREYWSAAAAFIEARNQRILKSVQSVA